MIKGDAYMMGVFFRLRGWIAIGFGIRIGFEPVF